MTRFALLVAAALSLSVSAGTVEADAVFVDNHGTIRTTVALPGYIVADGKADSCFNNPGPLVTLEGRVVLGELQARLIFRNNPNPPRPHEQQIKLDIEMLKGGHSMVFAKEPMLAGEGTNPNVYLQFFDDEGKAMSDEMPFDRCRKLLDTVYSHVEVQAELALDLNLDSCRASEGPYVDAVGDVKMGGVNGRMVFRRHQRGTAETNALSGLEFNVTLPGATFDVDPQTLAGGAGGNSYVFLQFLGDGAPVSEEVYLGRCGKF